MASIIENYSVAWGGHANNCSVSFTKLLQRMDLADVTLVANGVKIKAHRFVLSALSPYFDELFVDIPFNERAFGKIFDLLKQNSKSILLFRICFALISNSCLERCILSNAQRTDNVHISRQCQS